MPKPSKYRNVAIKIDDIRFASKKEAARYQQLKLLERAGNISGLELQKSFTLVPKQGGLRAVTYRADFCYQYNGHQVVEDVKGILTPVYVIKRALMFERHGIRICEI